MGRDYNIGNIIDISGFISSPHNTILQCVSHIGLIGFGLIIWVCLSIVDIKKIFNFNKGGMIMALALAVCFCALDNMSYIGFIYIVLTMLALTNTKTEIVEGEQNERSNT